MPRTRADEFDQKTKRAIADAARDENGIMRCQHCKCDMTGKRPIHDHWKRVADGGKPTKENGRILCEPCNAIITGGQNREHAKANRAASNHIGAKPKGAPIPQRPKPEKAPPRPLPSRKGGIFARYFGKEE